MPRINVFCRSSLIGALLALGACASSPVQFFSSEVEPEANPGALSRGDISLDCDSLGCSFRWFTLQSTLAELYADGDWDALAEQVSSVQYGQDLAYFYLGRAAEEQGAYDAAQLYFTQALGTAKRCSESLFSRCQGIEVASLSREHSERIVAMLTATEMDLADAQQVLSDMGLYTARVDGIYGPRTRAALQQFQENRRLGRSGKLDAATVRALLAAEASAGTRIAASPRPEPAPASRPQPEVEAEAPVDPADPEPIVAVAPAVAADVSAREAPAEEVEVEIEEKGESEPPNPAPIAAVATAPLPTATTMTSTKAASDADPAASAMVSPTAGERFEEEDLASVREAERSRLKLEVDLLSTADPFAEVLGVVEQGAWVEVLDWGSEWSRVSHGDRTGYVYTEVLQ